MSLPVVVYATDPLCGWCFAFVDSAAALRSEFGEAIEWRIACGGLVVGDRVYPIADAADYLRAGMRAVEARTSARFGAGFQAVLEDGRWVSNSEPACRACLVVQQRWGGAPAVDFAGALSQGFYGHGRVPDARDSLVKAAEHAGVDADELLQAWDTDDARKLTQQAFASARVSGLTSYPSLYLDTSTGLRPILAGWVSAADAVAAVRAALGSAA